MFTIYFRKTRDRKIENAAKSISSVLRVSSSLVDFPMQHRGYISSVFGPENGSEFRDSIIKKPRALDIRESFLTAQSGAYIEPRQ